MRNIFLERSFTECGVEVLGQQSKASYSLFLLYVQVAYFQKILKLRC